MNAERHRRRGEQPEHAAPGAASSRSGGAHHGLRQRDGAVVRLVPPAPDERPDRQREQPAEPRDREPVAGASRRASPSACSSVRSYSRNGPSSWLERAVRRSAARARRSSRGQFESAPPRRVRRASTRVTVRPAASTGGAYWWPWNPSPPPRRLLHHRPPRRSAGGRGRRAGRQELGAQADGGDAAGRRRVRAHQRARRSSTSSIMAELLGAIGVSIVAPGPRRARRSPTRGDLTPVAPYELVERIRASINVLGPLLTRCGHVRLSLPGGDDFGARPIDMHVAGLEAMGATFKFSHGYLEAFADRLHGADITFDFPSVGATENLLTAAVLRRGIDDDRQRRPRARDHRPVRLPGRDGRPHRRHRHVARCAIDGVERGSLHAAATTRPSPIGSRPPPTSPRCAVAGGEIVVRDARPTHMEMVLTRFARHGPRRSTRQPTACVVAAPERLRSIDVATLPYPGIATDYKPLIITMLSVADGVGIVTENLYPGRFRYVEELQRLGADIRTTATTPSSAACRRLSGAPVRAHDIRAGAAMVVAGLAAEGDDHDHRRAPHRPRLRRPRRPPRARRCRHRTRRTRLSGRARRDGQRPSPTGLVGMRSTSARSTDSPATTTMISDDRAGDEQHLVPTALVGEHAPRRGSAGIVRERNESYGTRWLNDLACVPKSKPAIEVIRPALQADDGDIELHRRRRGHRRRHRASGRCMRHVSGVDADAEGRHRAHHARPGRRRDRGGQRRRSATRRRRLRRRGRQPV